ncbi:frizzled-5 [Planococcus citri]|uniref:frizzled-5 n=1 Tax=Planococcus citri TaxID=170843 RepID=UPI0031FA3758
MSLRLGAWLLLIFTLCQFGSRVRGGGVGAPDQQLVIASSSSGSSYPGGSRCEEITIPMCKGIGYNLTYMPNELNHDSQEEAGMEVHQYWPLVEIKCSPDLKFFLCSLYTPICFEDFHGPLKACRSVCESARSGCEPLMKQYGFSWPERMNCDKLPTMEENPLCMAPPQQKSDLGSGLDPTKGGKKPPIQLPKCKPGQKKKGCREYGGGGFAMDTSPSGNQECSCRCRHPLVPIEHDSPWFNRSITVGEVNNCAYPCKGAFFFPEEQQFATTWIAVWSGLCCVATLMTLTTFLIDTERFKYPERPIVFLSGCYFMVSVGYLIRIFLGHEEVACENRMIVYSASGPKPCTLVFLLVYFFGMASSIWWVILTLTWFLAAGFKWSNEAIASYSQYFHLAAWLIPTMKSVGVLIMSAVDGDSVAGICSVGNQNPDNLRKFVLYPLIVYLIIGISLLFGGFLSLFRIRSVFKNQGGLGGRSKADKLEKLMIRIGIFSVLYTLPATVLIACYFYEATLYNEWMSSLACNCNESIPPTKMKNKPIYAVLMLKYFMALAVGITSGVWIWSGKTLGSWKKLWKRLFGGGSSKNHKSNLINNGTKPRVVKQQYLLPPSIPVPPVPAPSSSLLSGPHITPTGNLPLGGHHLSNASNLHHHMIKQSQQAPLSHV